MRLTKSYLLHLLGSSDAHDPNPRSANALLISAWEWFLNLGCWGPEPSDISMDGSMIMKLKRPHNGEQQCYYFISMQKNII